MKCYQFFPMNQYVAVCITHFVDKSFMKLFHTLLVSPWRQSCIFINCYLFSNFVSWKIYIPLTLKLRSFAMHVYRMQISCHQFVMFTTIIKIQKNEKWFSILVDNHKYSHHCLHHRCVIIIIIVVVVLFIIAIIDFD